LAPVEKSTVALSRVCKEKGEADDTTDRSGKNGEGKKVEGTSRKKGEGPAASSRPLKKTTWSRGHAEKNKVNWPRF